MKKSNLWKLRAINYGLVGHNLKKKKKNYGLVGHVIPSLTDKNKL